jgi:DNA-binding CsgD family transcriptional regulator
MPSSISQVYAGLSSSDLESVPLSALAPLTARQAEVLGWVATGKRNREIAKMLHCSVRTVEKHVENILEALNAETRGGVAAWWHQRCLALERDRAQNARHRSAPRTIEVGTSERCIELRSTRQHGENDAHIAERQGLAGTPVVVRHSTKSPQRKNRRLSFIR